MAFFVISLSAVVMGAFSQKQDPKSKRILGAKVKADRFYFLNAWPYRITCRFLQQALIEGLRVARGFSRHEFSRRHRRAVVLKF